MSSPTNQRSATHHHTEQTTKHRSIYPQLAADAFSELALSDHHIPRPHGRSSIGSSGHDSGSGSGSDSDSGDAHERLTEHAAAGQIGGSSVPLDIHGTAQKCWDLWVGRASEEMVVSWHFVGGGADEGAVESEFAAEEPVAGEEHACSEREKAPQR
ncbi:hypothetical protein ACEPAG_2006 [Sanghuangporus baumii]